MPVYIWEPFGPPSPHSCSLPRLLCMRTEIHSEIVGVEMDRSGLLWHLFSLESFYFTHICSWKPGCPFRPGYLDLVVECSVLYTTNFLNSTTWNLTSPLFSFHSPGFFSCSWPGASPLVLPRSRLFWLARPLISWISFCIFTQTPLPAPLDSSGPARLWIGFWRLTLCKPHSVKANPRD